jgi:hypothetical protein
LSGRGSPLRSTLPRPLKQPSRPPPSCEPRLPAAARRAARRVPRLPRHRTPRRRRFPPAAASESAQPPPLPPPAESVRNEPVLPRSESSCVYEMYQVGCARGRKERGGRAISRLMAGGASRRGSIYSCMLNFYPRSLWVCVTAPLRSNPPLPFLLPLHKNSRGLASTCGALRPRGGDLPGAQRDCVHLEKSTPPRGRRSSPPRRRLAPPHEATGDDLEHGSGWWVTVPVRCDDTACRLRSSAVL